MEKVFEELELYQKKRLLKVAREINPSLTEEDILQPFDFKELEQSPYFRYEEGVYCGILSAKAAFLASLRIKG